MAGFLKGTLGRSYQPSSAIYNRYGGLFMFIVVELAGGFLLAAIDQSRVLGV